MDLVCGMRLCRRRSNHDAPLQVRMGEGRDSCGLYGFGGGCGLGWWATIYHGNQRVYDGGFADGLVYEPADVLYRSWGFEPDGDPCAGRRDGGGCGRGVEHSDGECDAGAGGRTGGACGCGWKQPDCILQWDRCGVADGCGGDELSGDPDSGDL